MRFQILSHAGLAISGSGATLVCDPWLVGSCYWRSWWNYPPVSPDLIASLKPDFIYLTHIHWDHFHGPSLRRFSPSTPVLVPRGHFSKMKRDLNELGFQHVIELPHGQSFQLRPGFTLTPYEFYWYPDSAAVVECEGITLFNANDAKFMGGPLRQILGRHPRIDFVFFSHSSANERLCVEIIDRPEAIVEDPDQYVARFANFVRETGASYAIPFASNHCYLHRDVFHFNDTVQTPNLVGEYFARHQLERPRLKIMVSGDSYSTEAGFQTAEHDYFSARHERLREYAASVEDKLDAYYDLEAQASLTPEVVQGYVDKLSRAMPAPLRGLFRNQDVVFVLTAGERRLIYSVNFCSARVDELADVVDERHPIQVHTSAFIMRHCIERDLFSHLPISKRVRFRVSAGRKRYLDLLLFVFNLYECGWLPLRRVATWRFLTTWLARWREIVLYAQILADYALRRDLTKYRYMQLE